MPAGSVVGAAFLAAGLKRYFRTVEPNAARDRASIVAGSEEVRQAVCLSQGLAFDMVRFRYQRQWVVAQPARSDSSGNESKRRFRFFGLC